MSDTTKHAQHFHRQRRYNSDIPFRYSVKGSFFKQRVMQIECPPLAFKVMCRIKCGKPTVVRFHVTVLSLDTVDEGSMTYVADIFMSQSWKDYRLRLPENMTNYYRLLPVSWLKRMWRPDSFFKNAKKVTFQEMTIPNHYIWLYYDKTILYMVKLTLLLSCAMKFESYPHDTQTCSLKIESHESIATFAITLDISKAFDTVTHNVLFIKLENKGISGMA
ncbi:glycine receptor subunit alpha-4-like [Limulus polyphemus]|uniref:Glycine receptor subunit alpha-4-like n=1 Tax=Limulus polyphemus TaxID=6850 RepID=A0ABM1C5I2_LIMPO|nr:glycine receptor subunit alpha-4-like [Limulus polyphemus]